MCTINIQGNKVVANVVSGIIPLNVNNTVTGSAPSGVLKVASINKIVKGDTDGC